MTRRQWTGLAGVLFGIAMLAGLFTSGTTPDSDGAGAVDNYAKYWSDSGHQDRAAIGLFILLYAWVLLACFASGLRHLFSGLGDSPLRSVLQGAGIAAAALLAVGATLVNGVGLAGSESTGFKVDGNTAILLEDISYWVLSAGIMMAAAMALAFALANRRAGLVPTWSIVVSGLLALAGIGGPFTAWAGFILLPAWAIVIGVLLLATRGDDPAADPVGAHAAPVAT